MAYSYDKKQTLELFQKLPQKMHYLFYVNFRRIIGHKQEIVFIEY